MLITEQINTTYEVIRTLSLTVPAWGMLLVVGYAIACNLWSK